MFSSKLIATCIEVLILASLANAAESFPKCQTAQQCQDRIAQDRRTLNELLPTTVTRFVSVYTDENTKLEWSSALPGVYSNGCTDQNGKFDKNRCDIIESQKSSRPQVKIETSDAALACKDIGARLPTEEEFRSLMFNFGLSYRECYLAGATLSSNGISKMQEIFKDMFNDAFWTSSINIHRDRDHENVHGTAFRVGFSTTSFLRRETKAAVRCVRDVN